MSSSLINNGVNFVVFIFIARYLGATDFGSFSYVFAIASLFAMVGQMGLDGLLSRELIEEKENQPVILGTACMLRFFGYAIGALLTLGYGFAMPSHSDLEQTLFCIAALFVFSNVFNAIPENWLKTMHEARSASKARIIGSIIGGILKIFVLLSGGGVILVSIIHLLGLLLVSSGMFFFYGSKGGPKIRVWTISWLRARVLLSESWRVFLSALLWIVYLRIDMMILRQLSSPEVVGKYAISARLAEMTYVFPSALVVATFPSIMAAKGRSEGEYKNKLQALLYILSFSGLAIMIAMWGFAEILLVPIFGNEYQESVGVVFVYMMSTPFMFLHYALSRWILIERQTMFGLCADFCGVILNVVLNFALIPLLGIIGAAIATVISYAFVAFVSLLLTRKTREMFVMIFAALIFPWRGGGILFDNAKSFLFKKVRAQ